MNKKVFFLAFMLSFLVTTAFTINVMAWSNGGFSDDPSNPDYGTHDWIAQHALDCLPDEEKQYILNNLVAYLYGTELSDNGRAPDGIGDTAKHHIYYDSSGVMMDDAAAVRASTEYDNTLSFLGLGDFAKAAKNAGIMSHYIADMAVFGHVMGAGTDWGKEQHHSDYEDYVNQRTSSYDDEFNVFLSFDGSLDMISAYNAAKDLAYDTTFDVDGDLTCLWMDQNYDWNDPTFRDRCGESLNLAVNYLTDVLHTLHSEATESTAQNHVVINEVELNPPGDDNSLDVEEWVELYNPTSKSVDISGWKLSTTHGETVSVSIPQGTVIDADSYYVYGRGAQWLDNEDESVILRDGSDIEIDRTPKMSDTDNDGRSWQRYPNGQDTDTVADWSFRASTKGAPNDVSPSLITCSVSPSTVMPNNPVTVFGSISPSHAGVAVTLTYIRPDGSEVIRNVNSAVDGNYNDVYKPDQSGSWSVKASWPGDIDHEGAESSFISFVVGPVDTTPPVANAGPDQTVNEDTLVTFDGSWSSDNIGIVSYIWTFVDITQQTLTGVSPTYTFATPGVYTVTLNVTDAAGNPDTDTVKITVLDVTNPMADAGRDQRVKAGETVSFDASGSSDKVAIISYEWDFGDGTTGTGITTTHTYTEPGTYTVILTVKDEAGNTDKDTMIIIVEKVPPFPWWIVGVITAAGVASIAITFWRRGAAKSRSAPSGRAKTPKSSSFKLI